MLERLFFKAFFAALVARGYGTIDWRSDETDVRFRCVYEYLRSLERKGTNLARLVDRLRPDPISGSNPALDTNLMHLQPGVVKAPNHNYEGVELSVAAGDMRRLLEALPEDLKNIIEPAADAFVRKESKLDIARA
jgi:hypothetical protein